MYFLGDNLVYIITMAMEKGGEVFWNKGTPSPEKTLKQLGEASKFKTQILKGLG